MFAVAFMRNPAGSIVTPMSSTGTDHCCLLAASRITSFVTTTDAVSPRCAAPHAFAARMRSSSDPDANARPFTSPRHSDGTAERSVVAEALDVGDGDSDGDGDGARTRRSCGRNTKSSAMARSGSTKRMRRARTRRRDAGGVPTVDRVAASGAGGGSRTRTTTLEESFAAVTTHPRTIDGADRCERDGSSHKQYRISQSL